MVLVYVLGVIMFGAAVFLVFMATAPTGADRGVSRSLAALEAISPLPAELKTDLDRSFEDRVIEPLRQRALSLGRRLSGSDSSERLRRKLDLAGNPRDWSVDRVISGKVIGAIAIALVALALGLMFGAGLVKLLLLVVGGAVLGFYVPDLYLYQRTYDRSEQLRRDLPDALDLLTISVESGLGFDAAVQQVARNSSGPLAEEFSRMLQEMQLGSSRSESLRAMSERTNVDDVKGFVGAMVQADAFGIPIADVLRVQSQEMRDKRRQRAETKAQQVPVKMTVPLIFFILPCLFAAIMGPAAINIMDNF